MSGEVAVSSETGSAAAHLMTWARQNRPSLTILAVELVLHLWVVLIVVLPGGVGSPVYLTEYVFCVSFAAVIAPATLFAKSAPVFRVLILIRLAFVVVSLNILGPTLPLVWILLSLVPIIELFAYDDGAGRNVILGIAVLACLGSAVARVALDRPPGGVAFAGSIAICVTLVSAVVFISSRYREQLVERTRRVRTLEATVANLASANKAFQSYADHLESESTEKERNRITRELHDTIGYALTNVIVMMNAGKILLDDNPEALRSVLGRVSEQSEAALDDVRRTLHQMAAIPKAEPMGLQAIYNLTRVFEGAMGIVVRINRGNFPWTLGQRLDEIVFRVVQEGLTNAFRHGKATEVLVFLWRATDEIRVRVRDNGRGAVSPAVHQEGIGLKGIRMRLHECGGSLFTHNLSLGYELEVQIPYRLATRKTYRQES